MKPSGGKRLFGGTALALGGQWGDRSLTRSAAYASDVPGLVPKGFLKPDLRNYRKWKGKKSSRVEVGTVELDAVGKPLCTVRGRAAQVDEDFVDALRRRAFSGPAKVFFAIVAYDDASDSFNAIPGTVVKRAGRIRFTPLATRVPKQLPSPKARPTRLRLPPGSETLKKQVSRPVSEEATRQLGTAGMHHYEATSQIVLAFIAGNDAHAVFNAVRRADAGGQYARVCCLAEVLLDIDERLEGEGTIACYKRLLPEADELGFGEVKPLILHEIAKVAKRLGRGETAASYALGAARHALENGEHVIARNLLRESRRMEIL